MKDERSKFKATMKLDLGPYDSSIFQGMKWVDDTGRRMAARRKRGCGLVIEWRGLCEMRQRSAAAAVSTAAAVAIMWP